MMKHSLLLLATTAVLPLLLPAVAAAHEQEFRATVIEIIDGDTLRVEHDGTKEVVRLLNIDAPEPGQPNAERAKHVLGELCLNELVRIIWTERDKDGTILGTVHEDSGLNVSFEMVKEGMAWNYLHFEHDRTLAQLESEARKAKRGLWAGRRPTPPWEYRKQHQKPEMLSGDNVPKRR
jgi:micrococcal nuclease